MSENILITICARGGSKGVPGKNLRPLLGRPLLDHTISLAQKLNWNQKIVVSTDSEEIAARAKTLGVEVPWLRPLELATDEAGKIPVLTHAVLESEKLLGESFDVVCDLDVTAPIRTIEDLERGLGRFRSLGGKTICFSVTHPRKNPYFNIIERQPNGSMGPVKMLATGLVSSRQKAPEVWEMNASIYFYPAGFLRAKPASLWHGPTDFFVMPPESAFDIDEERDFTIVEALLKNRG